MPEQHTDAHRIIHGDDIEIFINDNRMVTIKADDYGADDNIICISSGDIDEVCQVLQRLKQEISK